MHDLIIGESSLQLKAKNKTESHSNHSGLVHENYSHQFSTNFLKFYSIVQENAEKTHFLILNEQTSLNFYLDKIWEPPKFS